MPSDGCGQGCLFGILGAHAGAAEIERHVRLVADRELRGLPFAPVCEEIRTQTGTNACAMRPGCARLHRLTIGAQDTILPHVRADDRSARKPNGLAIGERASEAAVLAISFGAMPNAHDS